MKNPNITMGFPNGNSRRQFLKLAGYSALGLMTTGFGPLLNSSEARQNPEKIPETEFIPDLDISLIAQSHEVAVFPGRPTQIWRYHAIIHKGDKNRVIKIPRSYLGPIIKAWQGEKIRIRFANSIPEESIISLAWSSCTRDNGRTSAPCYSARAIISVRIRDQKQSRHLLVSSPSSWKNRAAGLSRTGRPLYSI
jgi:hypothetical protein